MSEGSVRFEVSTSLLDEVLRLPADHHVVGVEWFHERSVNFIVSGPDFPEGQTDCEPVLTRHDDGSITWDFGL